MRYLGVHLGSSEEGLEFGKTCIENGVRTFQMYFSNPRRWERPNPSAVKRFFSENLSMIRDSDKPNFNLVIHGPFGVSLAKYEQYQFISRYFLECSCLVEDLSFIESQDTVNLVTHMGSRVVGKSLDDTLKHIRDLIMMWEYNTLGHKSVLCLENDAGSKKGTKLGSVKFLKKLLDMEQSLSRVKMCWDTEHAFANGFDLSDVSLVNDTLRVSSVVHLNSVPPNVVRGGHLDRHSETLIVDGQEVESLLRIAKLCEQRGIPMILERDKDISLQDYYFIEGRCQ